MKFKSLFVKNYAFSLLLICCIVIGSVAGVFLEEKAFFLKPLGDIFLNLLFTIVVPLVFFSISSAIAAMTDVRRLGKILTWMVLIFVLTGVLASGLMVIGVRIYPPAKGITLNLDSANYCRRKICWP